MKIIKKLLWGVFISLLFSCTTSQNTSTEFLIDLSIQPASENIQIGDSSQLNIVMDECTEPIFALTMQIEFSAELISVDSSEIGDFFSQNAINLFQIEDNIMYISISSIQGEESVSGNGSLMGIHFTAFDVGTAEISIIPGSVNIFDATGNTLEADEIKINNSVIEID